jgi:hypothetical protein
MRIITGKLVPLLGPLAILLLADALLAYSVPIYAQALFANEFIVGLVIAFSSVVGLAFDFLSKRFFGTKPFSFFIKISFVLSIVFAYALGASFVTKYLFLFAMAVWGIYYETLAFANFKFLKTHVDARHYSFSWGCISMVKALIYGFGPLIATSLLAIQLQLPAYVCGTFVLAMFLVYLAYHTKSGVANAPSTHTITARPELKVWLVLFKRVYPMWLLNLMLIIIDSGFWTVGILLSTSLSKTEPLARLLIPMYMLPAVVFSPLSQTISARFGKKKTAIVTAFIASLMLILTGVASTTQVILAAIFAYAVFVSLALPAIYATFEDYVSRLGEFDTDLIGLEQSSTSLAYIIGPVLAGFIALTLSDQKVFLLFGIMLALVACLAFFVTPRKIKMPQSQLLKVA